jgi:hypothetical protein
MLITHTGDVSESRAGLTAGLWLLVLTDRTSSLSVIVHCKGETLIEAAKMAKVGQVFEVIGWTSKPPSTRGFTIAPIILRAKSGTNENDINLKTSAYTNGLMDGNNPVLEAEVNRLKAELANASLNFATKADEVERFKGENTRLRAQVEQLDSDLQAERIMNSVMGGNT